MEGLSVIKTLRNRSILLTGSTGYLGKVVLEKILRDVPDVSKIFVLIRDNAAGRLETEIYKSKIFEHLQSIHGDSWKSFFFSKVIPISGDIIEDQIGLSPNDLATLREEANFVIHCASTVDFNERLDKAIRMNVIGSLQLFELSKSFKNLGCYIQVSTAYVAYNRTGFLEETLPQLNFDPEEMVRLILQMEPAQIELKTPSLLSGFPNSYVFTKAITERILESRKGNVPMSFIRPSIMGAAWKEPMEGWTDSVNQISSVILYTGVGLVKFIHGDHQLIADIAPVDTIANVILAAIAATVAEPQRLGMYHVGTSEVNPIRWFEVSRWVGAFWRQHNVQSRVDKTPLHFKFYKSRIMYRTQYLIRYEIPSGLYSIFAKTIGTTSQKKTAKQYRDITRSTLSVSKSFARFTMNEFIFSTKNTQEMMRQIVDAEKDKFYFGLEELDWERYFRFFCYGMQRWILKEDVRPPTELLKIDVLSEPRKSNEDTSLSFIKHLFPDLHWVLKSYRTHIGVDSFATLRTPAETKNLILNSVRVREAIKKVTEQERVNESVVEARASAILERLGHTLRLPVVRAFGYSLRKIFRKIYDGIHVNESGMEQIRASLTKGPLVFIPTHRSYIDFIILSYVCFEFDLPLPHIAAGEDFLAVMFVNWIFRNSGAFFLRRSFKGDHLYIALFTEYVYRLVCDWSPIEFFIEGKRSRTGKSLHPKFGLLSMCVDPYFNKKVPSVTIAPISISYEKALEAELYSNELLGEQKQKESFEGLMRASSVLKMNFGRINVHCCPPIDVHEFTTNLISQPPELITNGALSRKLDPFANKDDRKYVLEHLGYRTVYDLNKGMVLTTTALVGTILLTHRKGLTSEDLKTQVDWLREEVTSRGATVAFEGSTTDLIEHALKLLSNNVVRHRTTISYAIAENTDKPHKNLLVLSFYRNQILHLFTAEGMIACALSHIPKEGVKHSAVIEGAKFLNKLLWNEFVNKPTPNLEEDFEEVLKRMIEKQYLQDDKGIVNITSVGEGPIAFLSNLFWPLIDSYWVSAISLYSLQPNLKVKRKLLLQRIQWVAEKMHSEDKLAFYESCSMETLTNTLDLFKKWRVLDFKYPNIDAPKATGKKESKKDKAKMPSEEPIVFLVGSYQKEAQLQDLIMKIAEFRKPQVIREGGPVHKRAMITDFPLLSKM